MRARKCTDGLDLWPSLHAGCPSQHPMLPGSGLKGKLRHWWPGCPKEGLWCWPPVILLGWLVPLIWLTTVGREARCLWCGLRSSEKMAKVWRVSDLLKKPDWRTRMTTGLFCHWCSFNYTFSLKFLYTMPLFHRPFRVKLVFQWTYKHFKAVWWLHRCVQRHSC